ncbi:MAG: hypothetical protein ACI9VR_000121 [Cognaticolwellia sp.]|jgi:hypothetical protein
MTRATPALFGFAALILWGGLGCSEVEDVSPAETTARVIAGGSFNCLLSTKGHVWCEDYERAEAREIANEMDTEGVFTKVLAGGYAACGLTEKKKVHCWGNPSSDIIADEPSGEFEELYADLWGACAVDASGSSTCWSMEPDGEIPAGSGVIPSSIVGAHSSSLCGLDATGTIHCWGKNGTGSSAPTGVFTDLRAGTMGFAARAQDGSWRWWGRNSLGEGDIPTDIEIIDLAFGSYHGCALDPDGKVHCWGAIDPDGEEPYRWQLDVPEDETFVSIDANLWHTCGVTTEGDVRCWGCNTWLFPDYWDPEDHCNDPNPPWDQ